MEGERERRKRQGENEAKERNKQTKPTNTASKKAGKLVPCVSPKLAWRRIGAAIGTSHLVSGDHSTAQVSRRVAKRRVCGFESLIRSMQAGMQTGTHTTHNHNTKRTRTHTGQNVHTHTQDQRPTAAICPTGVSSAGDI